MVVSVWKAADKTIGASLSAFLFFRPKHRCRIISAKCDNSTRLEADPRYAIIGVGPENDAFGHLSYPVAAGYTCSYGDLIWEPTKPVILEPTQQIIFKVSGENGDTAGARVLYELIP